MALTFTIQIDKAVRSEKGPEGAIMALVEMTTSLGAGNATDYSSGFDIAGNVAKFGMNKLWTVIPVSAKNNAGTTLSNKVWFTYDSVNGKLRAWAGSTGASNMTEESGSNIDAGGTVRFVAIGV